MRWCSKILHISYKDHVTIEEVRAKIQQAIGPHEDLLIIVKRCKLKGLHVSCSSGLAKTILQDTVKEGRRQTEEEMGRHQGMDRPWARMSQGAVETGKKWRKLVVKSSVVPQWPLQLGDRWRWSDCMIVVLTWIMGPIIAGCNGLLYFMPSAMMALFWDGPHISTAAW